MKAKSIDALPVVATDGETEDGWLYEPKWDGFRCLAFCDGTGGVALQSGSGRTLERYFPEVVAALAPGPAGVLDGEITIAPELGGFDALGQRIHPAASRIERLASETPARLVVFDLLDDGDASLLDTPLADRRAALAAFALPAGVERSPAATSYDEARRWLDDPRLDGLIAKRLDREYRPGKRDAAVKWKRRRTADCVVAGFREAKGDPGRVGSLLLGLYGEDGELIYIGHAGGFSEPRKRELFAQVSPLRDTSAFGGERAPGAPSRWGAREDSSWVPLRPELVGEIAYDTVTGRRLRHGSALLRFRVDKPPADCTIDQLDP